MSDETLAQLIIAQRLRERSKAASPTLTAKERVIDAIDNAIVAIVAVFVILIAGALFLWATVYRRVRRSQ